MGSWQVWFHTIATEAQVRCGQECTNSTRQAGGQALCAAKMLSKLGACAHATASAAAEALGIACERDTT